MTLDRADIADLLKSLERISNRLERIDEKLDRIMEVQKTPTQYPTPTASVTTTEPLDVFTLLSLPDHLRKSAMILNRLREATASEVSKETGRARAVESGYLNQLVVMGHLKKVRRGREVYFSTE